MKSIVDTNPAERNASVNIPIENKKPPIELATP